MELLAKLLLAHLIGDFLFQSDRWLKQKEDYGFKAPFLYVHALIHGLLVWIFAWGTSFWLPAAIIAITHGIIDGVKMHYQTEQHKKWWFAGDQLMHLLIIIIVWVFWTSPDLHIPEPGIDVWVMAIAYLFVTIPASVIIQILIGQWAALTGEQKDESLENAGKYIGILERLFVLTFIITGHWNAVGFLVAAKSVFRFGDLKESKNRKLTEYILIGTLTSLGIAMFTGIIAAYLVKL